jgi:hypothetical protein
VSIWKQLSKWFNPKDFNKTAQNYTTYFQSAFQDGELAHDFLGRLTKFRNRIMLNTMTISDDCHIWQILDSLLLAYQNLTTALRVQKDNTVDYIKKAIIDFKVTTKKGKSKPATAPAVALYTHDQQSLKPWNNGHPATNQQLSHNSKHNQHGPSSQGQHSNNNHCHKGQNHCGGQGPTKDNNAAKKLNSNFNKNKYCTYCEHQGHNYNICHNCCRSQAKVNMVSTIMNNNNNNCEHMFMVASVSCSASYETPAECTMWYLNSGASQHFMCD